MQSNGTQLFQSSSFVTVSDHLPPADKAAPEATYSKPPDYLDEERGLPPTMPSTASTAESSYDVFLS